MKPTDKDIKEAREYLEEKYPNQDLYYQNDDNEIVDYLDTLLSEYVLHLEAKGIIKFTQNREQHPEYINCSDCERKNCYYNEFCVGCGRKMPHHA